YRPVTPGVAGSSPVRSAKRRKPRLNRLGFFYLCRRSVGLLRRFIDVLQRGFSGASIAIFPLVIRSQDGLRIFRAIFKKFVDRAHCNFLVTGRLFFCANSP
ncbi:hypothetical protein, partial [Pandoraea sp. ISTKB]|uniref:hypothetical protein n=1 Tax=Pandoraea sp. ISTKB TaxID=1586708 RepID=UPI0019807AEA